MQIVIDHPGHYLIAQGEEPEVGVVYALEIAAEGTERQNRAFHPLMIEYYRSGLWSYAGSGYQAGATLSEFKDLIKRKLGAGFESYVYAVTEGGRAVIHKAKRYEDIPEDLRSSPERRQLILGKLKSWADYTKKERRLTLDNLIAEMHQVGVQTKRFYEILEGMEEKATR
jgi:hypothetical protein